MAAIQNKKYKVNMCEGPLLKQIIVFAIPLMMTSLLQLFFHAADLIVVGKYASHEALAAVGATASLSGLIVNLFFGLSVGANVVVARLIGENNRIKIFHATHTAITISLIGGIILSFIGIIFSKNFLKMMDTPEEILGLSTLYMQINFAGMPIAMFYHFGSAILRSIGDTKRPFYFLTIAGIVNVILNMFFVIVCHWSVGGVATATVASQVLSAFMILQVLTKSRESYRIDLKRLHIHWETLKEMMRIGIPTGFQGACFSLANILIQAAINSFGATAVAGNTAAMTVETIGYVSIAAIGQSTLTFTSQNYGGKQYHRIRDVIKYTIMLSVVCSIIVCITLYILRYWEMSLFTDNTEVVNWGIDRLKILLPVYFICGIMDVITNGLRGLGYSISPTIIMILGICVFRIVWIKTVFASSHTLLSILITFPLSWIIVIIACGTLLYKVLQKMPKHNQKLISQNAD